MDRARTRYQAGRMSSIGCVPDAPSFLRVARPSATPGKDGAPARPGRNFLADKQRGPHPEHTFLAQWQRLTRR